MFTITSFRKNKPNMFMKIRPTTMLRRMGSNPPKKVANGLRREPSFYRKSQTL